MTTGKYLFVFVIKLKILRNFFVFSLKSQFSTPVQFCFTRVARRDLIDNACNNGWLNDFMLYGGTNHTNNAIPLYHYFNTDRYSSNLFMNDSAEETRTLERSVLVPTIYIPSKYFVPKNHKQRWEIIKPYFVLPIRCKVL